MYMYKYALENGQFSQLKFCKKSKFDWNELKLSTQHKAMYTIRIRKKLLKKILHFSFLVKFGPRPCTIYSTGTFT